MKGKGIGRKSEGDLVKTGEAVWLKKGRAMVEDEKRACWKKERGYSEQGGSGLLGYKETRKKIR
jgi:hypothetical protein